MERRLDYQDLNTIKPSHTNPKEHQIDNVRASIDRFGYVAPMIIDDRTGRLVVGHGRLESLKARRDAGETPPEGIQTDDTGRWLAPVIHGWASRSDADAAAYLVLDNRQTELGGWDHHALADLLDEIGDPDLIELTGWDPADLEELLSNDDNDDYRPDLVDPDDIPEKARHSVSKPGDIWRLGPHSLLCGDSTDIATVESLWNLNEDRANCMWTDPPYGIGYIGKTKNALTIKNDNADDLAELLAGAFAVATTVLMPGAPVYVAHPPGVLQMEFINAFRVSGWRLCQNLIWIKNSFVLGHSDYHYRHEPIIYGFTPGGEGRSGREGDRWYGDNAQDSVFEIERPTRSEHHPNMKPVALITAMLANSCPQNGLVYDPFGGSGTTLIAAHALKMRSVLVELDPQYVDVACRRFQKLTEIVPERVLEDGTTEPHDFTIDSEPES